MNRVLMLGACFQALLFLLCSCSGGGEGKKAPKAESVPVVAVAAATRSVPIVVRAVGNVEPMATVSVKPQVGGAIVEQRVTDGADVAKGDLLFRLDPRPFEMAVREAQARLERDRALLVKASEDLKRYATLRAKDVVAQEQYDNTFSQARTLEGTINLDQAGLDRARLDLEYATIRAPITGRVGAVLLTSGNVLKANDDRVMCVINQLSPIFIAFSVPERWLPQVMARFSAGTLTVTAAPEGETGPPVEAKLASVDNTVDARTGAIRLKAVSDNAGHRLWPGQFVRVDLKLSELDAALVIPTRAVMDGLNGPYVYVVGKDGLVAARQVTPGPIIDDITVVEKGLAPGEQVVVDGQIRLAPGTRAQITPVSETPSGKKVSTGEEVR